jgi:hypothetical protein
MPRVRLNFVSCSSIVSRAPINQPDPDAAESLFEPEPGYPFSKASAQAVNNHSNAVAWR